MNDRTHDTQLSKQILSAENWSQFSIGSRKLGKKRNEHLSVSQTPSGILFKNDTGEKARFAFSWVIKFPAKGFAGLLIQLAGAAKHGSGCLWANKSTLPLNGQVSMPKNKTGEVRLTFECSAHSEIEFTDCDIIWTATQVDLTEECSREPQILVVVPDYPTEANLYLAAFAHSRNRRYVQSGLDIQVIVAKTGKVVQASYVMDGVPVLVGGPKDLKMLINRRQYRTIVVHFVDLMHYDIFDGYIANEQLIFICHGPETSFPCLPNVARPYFSKPIKNPKVNTKKIEAVQRYARKDNVDWVFVSDWLMNESEKLMDVEFKNKHVIHNVIDENLFPYREKTAEDRRNILMLRRFDDNCYHSVDIAIESILALSRRPVFKDLHFEIVGDGALFPLITAPVKDFSNVTLRRTFVPNSKIAELHARNGILLAPSRHDSQGVSSCEAASSGLVVAGSNVTCSPFFFEEDVNHTLTDPEDPEALADTIERLYDNPDEYLEISQRMSRRIRDLCSISQTSDREVALISQSLEKANERWEELPRIVREGDPVLTIGIPSYNIEGYIEKCLRSLLSHRNAGKLEILVINDGSTDRTKEVAEKIQAASPEVVRIIDKPNGGYGSAVNVAIAEARGTFFRIVDGDDWLQSDNLASLIDLLEQEEEADLVLTVGRHESFNSAKSTPIQTYEMLAEGRLYHFEDLTYPGYGFKTYGPLLSSSSYRTEKLKEGSFALTEHTPYVDMEYNAFGIQNIDGVRYHDLDIYRYLMGREGQSISLDAWKHNYEKHRKVIFSILERVLSGDGYTPRRKDYVVEHIVAPMADSQLAMYDALGLWDEIPGFLDELDSYPGVREKCEEYIRKTDSAVMPVLKYYKQQLTLPEKDRRKLQGVKSAPRPADFKHRMAHVLRALTPYGVIERRRKEAEKEKKAAEAERKAITFD